jgi:hypothetical protein
LHPATQAPARDAALDLVRSDSQQQTSGTQP